MSMDIKFIPLSFINSSEEILKQIKNTVLFSFLFKQYEETTLEHYLETTQYGYTASALHIGKHKLVRITDINDGKVNWNTVPFCNCDSENKYLLKDNDILIARTGGTTGKSFIVNSPPSNAVFASYLIRLRLNKLSDINFINLFLNSYTFWSQIVEMKTGSAMPNVNAEKLKTLKLPKCDIETQRKIVAFFGNEEFQNEFSFLFNEIDFIENLFNYNKDLSTTLTHQQTHLTQLRQAFLREAMQGKLVKQDKKDGHAADLLTQIKDEKEKLIAEKKIKKEKPLPPIKAEEIPFEIPENWVWCRLGEIAEIVRGGSPRPAGDPTYYGGNIPFLKVGDLTGYEDIYVRTHAHSIKEAGLYKTRFVEADTLMLTNSGATLGVPRICTFATTFNDGIAAFLNLHFIDKVYLYYFLLSRTDWFLMEASRGQGQPNLNIDIISSTLLPLPPLPEQKRIVKKLEEVMKVCDELKTSIADNQKYTELLLQVALRDALQPKEVEEARIHMK